LRKKLKELGFGSEEEGVTAAWIEAKVADRQAARQRRAISPRSDESAKNSRTWYKFLKIARTEASAGKRKMKLQNILRRSTQASPSELRPNLYGVDKSP